MCWERHIHNCFSSGEGHWVSMPTETRNIPRSIAISDGSAVSTPRRVAEFDLDTTRPASISRNAAMGRATWRHLSSSPNHCGPLRKQSTYALQLLKSFLKAEYLQSYTLQFLLGVLLKSEYLPMHSCCSGSFESRVLTYDLLRSIRLRPSRRSQNL